MHYKVKFSIEKLWKIVYVTRREAAISTRAISALVSLEHLTSHSLEIVAFLPSLRNILLVIFSECVNP